ncbi:MAG: hypothetical protein GF408_00195 [Candidatus Omnitrophica bacterium]|nr:hypothetical protein [Candidatus Omnitrophota bacterium]
MKKLLAMSVVLALIFMSVPCNGDNGEGKAVVIAVEGNVSVMIKGAEKPVVVKEGMELSGGDVVRTERKASLELAFDKEGGNVVKLGGSTEAIIMITDEDRLELVKGEIITFLKNLHKGETFRIRTPAAACGARGTGWKMRTDGKVLDLEVFDGVVFIRPIERSGKLARTEYLIERGFTTRVKKFDRPEKKKRMPEGKLEALRNEITLPRKMMNRKKEMTADEAKVEMNEKRLARTISSVENKLNRISSSITRKDYGHSDQLVPARTAPVQMKSLQMRNNLMMDGVKNKIEENRQVQRTNLLDKRRMDLIERNAEEDNTVTETDTDNIKIIAD